MPRALAVTRNPPHEGLRPRLVGEPAHREPVSPEGERSAREPEVEVVFGVGALCRLSGIVGGFAPRRVLVVGSRSGLARARIPDRLGTYRPRYFTDFTANPQLADVLAGCAVVESYRPDLIVGVGGRSALDVAKMVRLLPPGSKAALAALAGGLPATARRVPLLLVPTTAGTGAEVTRFATVPGQQTRHSLDHPGVRAEVALIDPALTDSCPPQVTYNCALEALAHAIESMWSIRSTNRSRTLAAAALAALVPVLSGARWPLELAIRELLSAASIQAGLAIDITRTTVGHAFAYPLTARFGLRHGLACALNLAWLLPLTARRCGLDCQDPRGAAFVAGRLEEISRLLGAAGPADGGEVIASFLVAAGFAPRLAAYGLATADLPWLVRAGLGSTRAGGGPIRLDPDVVTDHLGHELARGPAGPAGCDEEFGGRRTPATDSGGAGAALPAREVMVAG